MDTSLLNVDLQPSYIRCDIKGKITQIKFPEEIMVEKSKVQRSQTTGWLCVTMPKADARQIEAKKAKYAEIKAFAQGKKKEEELEKMAENLAMAADLLGDAEVDDAQKFVKATI